MKTLLLSVFMSFMIFVMSAQAKSNFDLTYNLGPTINQSDNIENLGDPNLSTGFGFNYFFNKNHGVGLGYNSEGNYEGTIKSPELHNASISTFDIHYIYRFIKGKFHFLIEPGIGHQTIYDEATDYYWGYLYNDAISSAFILNYKLWARYVITEWDPDGPESEAYFFVGAGIIHNFSFDDDLNGRDISGNRLAALAQIGIGW